MPRNLKAPGPKYYNQRVKHMSFLLGGLVLRKVILATKEPHAGKLGLTWEGPYKVVKVFRPETYWLEDMDRKALLKNSDEDLNLSSANFLARDRASQNSTTKRPDFSSLSAKSSHSFFKLANSSADSCS